MPRERGNKSGANKNLEFLTECIKEVLNNNHANLVFDKTHHAVYDLMGQLRKKDLDKLLLDQVGQRFAAWGEELDKLAGNPLLNRFSSICTDFKMFCFIIPKIYESYDDFIEKNNTKERSSLLIIRDLFESVVLQNSTRISAINDRIIEEIRTSRGEQKFDTSHLRTIILMYYTYLQANPEYFDKMFDKVKAATEQYYKDYFNQKYESMSFPKFLAAARNQLIKEEKIIYDIFKAFDANQLLKIAHSSCLFNNEKIFIDGKEPPISLSLIDSDITPLKWLAKQSYIRFDRPITNLYKKCAEFAKREILKFTPKFEEENLKASVVTKQIGEIMDRIIELEKPYNEVFLINDETNSDVLLEFERQVKEGWNDPKFNIVNNFIIYIDTNVRAQLKNLTPEEQIVFPERCAKFYNLLSDKMPFSKTYDVYFVQRLIKYHDKLRDIEYPIIEKIRTAKQASDFMKNYKSLMRAVDVSKELEAEFLGTISNRLELFPPDSKKMGFSPLVIDKPYYSPFSAEEKVLPHFLSPIHGAFTTLYGQKHQSALLTLAGDASTVEFKWKVPASKARKAQVYIISCDVFCAKVLYCVATRKRVSAGDIIDDAQEDRALICKYIMKLIQTKIFKRVSFKDKKLQDADEFEMNSQFWQKVSKIVIPTQVSAKKENQKVISSTIEANKLNIIKANIVRALKQRNRIAQADLETIVMTEMSKSFKPEVALVRKELTNLEGEYFTRDGIGPNEVLVYVQ